MTFGSADSALSWDRPFHLPAFYQLMDFRPGQVLSTSSSVTNFFAQAWVLSVNNLNVERLECRVSSNLCWFQRMSSNSNRDVAPGHGFMVNMVIVLVMTGPEDPKGLFQPLFFQE